MRAWMVVAGLCAATSPAHGAWESRFGIGYGESIALDRGPTRARVPLGRGRIHHRSRGGWLLGADLTFPFTPGLPYGQMSAGLSAGRAFALGATRLLAAGGPDAVETGWELRTGVGAGWCYVQSEVSEGYISLSDQAVSFHGPYAALDGELLWTLRPQRGRLSVALGLGLTAGVARAYHRIPDLRPSLRLAVDGTLVAALSW